MTLDQKFNLLNDYLFVNSAKYSYFNLEFCSTEIDIFNYLNSLGQKDCYFEDCIDLDTKLKIFKNIFHDQDVNFLIFCKNVSGFINDRVYTYVLVEQIYTLCSGLKSIYDVTH